MNEKLTPLSQLREGEEGIIHALTSGRELSTRLAGMGIALNMKIKVLRTGSGLIIVQAGDTRVALGGGEADKILLASTDALECKTADETKETRRLLVALSGPPNAGKSTVFNILAGISQHVDNWPGKTVEKKEGIHTCGDEELRIVDLPGTYSLTSFSDEEHVARDFILTERPDVIVLIANASALERSLYLLTELLLMGPPVIVAVNQIDVAEDQGIRIDTVALQKCLGIPVLEMIATKNRGIKELVSQIIDLSKGELQYHPHPPRIAADHQHVFQTISDLLSQNLSGERATDGGYRNLLTVKLMEGDPEISKIVEDHLPEDICNKIKAILVRHEDSLHAVVGGRYDWIEEVMRATVERFKMGQVVMTDRIDHILTRPLFGIPILLAVFAGVFFITYQVGYPLQKGLEWLVRAFAGEVEPFLEPFPLWLKGIIVDGIIGGAGSVLTFIPILVIFFAVIALLEDVHYMARAAFVMDRFMHVIGLHGKSVIPLCLGFGCNVPSILGARIVESKKERLLTIFLSPFIPCTARLAVLTFVTAAMFPKNATAVSWSILAADILILGLTGIVASRFVLKDSPMPFIMELPLYHKPDPKTIGMVIWASILSFVKKAGTVILFVSILIWILAHLPHGRIEDSYLAIFGQFIEPIGKPMGLDWKMMTALLTSIVAKENSMATLGVLYGVGREGLVHTLPSVMSHASALAFLVVLMLFIPCAATLAVMKRELDSWKWFSASFTLMLAISFIGGVIAYHVALWIGL
ncbi:MAG: ferrous iron transport protein B [Syntrophales bacterium]|nr:ferrous iron transport protein B [Syntrophales bacterium]